MLSLFPQILFLSPLGAAILRIAAAFAFAYIAYSMVTMRDEIAHTKFFIFGNVSEGLVWISATIVLAVAILLFMGLYTQAAAILGMIVSLKHALFARRYERIIPLSLAANLLLFVICASLLVTGPGPLALDLPL